MKCKGILGLSGLMVAAIAVAAIPPEPMLSPVPAPTASQLQTTPVTTVTPLTLTADQQAATAAAQAWVIVVGQPQAIAAANQQVSALQTQGFSAFSQSVTTTTAQVLVGPEVDMTHLKHTQQQLIKSVPIVSTQIQSYNINS